MGSDLKRDFASSTVYSATVPLSKSLAAASYDKLSKTKVTKKQIDYESLPIKYFSHYSINCLKDGSDEMLWSSIGIFGLNIFGAITDTKIDYPVHWFLIAKVSNLTNDIENIISIAREAIETKSVLKIAMEQLGPIIFTNKIVLEVYLSFTEKYSKLLKEYSEKCRIYFSRNDKNEFNGFCAAEFFKIYVKFKKSIEPDLISEALDELERNLKKREIKKYFLIEKGSNYKGITKYENVDEIFEHEKSNYHNNKVNYEDKYSLKKKITIKDVDDYVKTLSDSYNLIDDNCQTFVRNILNRFE